MGRIAGVRLVGAGCEDIASECVHGEVNYQHNPRPLRPWPLVFGRVLSTWRAERGGMFVSSSSHRPQKLQLWGPGKVVLAAHWQSLLSEVWAGFLASFERIIVIRGRVGP